LILKTARNGVSQSEAPLATTVMTGKVNAATR